MPLCTTSACIPVVALAGPRWQSAKKPPIQVGSNAGFKCQVYVSGDEYIRVMRKVLALVLVALAGFGATAAARDRDADQERARRAFENGEILPIMEILAIVSQHLPGDVVEVELEVERDHIYYEVDVLTATGRVREIVIDGRTGAIIEIDD